MTRKAPDLLARTAGGLLGLACGDALGAPIELRSSTRRHGTVTEMTAGGRREAGEWTADTGMALAVAEGILASPADPVPGTGERFLAWAETAPQGRRDGGTVAAALAAFRRTGDWAVASRDTPQARDRRATGHGSLARALPAALAYADAAALLTQSARLSAMTHWDPQAEVCCAIYCLWIRELLAGAGLQAGWETALREARLYQAGGALALDTPGPRPLPDGFWPRLKNLPALTYGDLQPSGFAGYCVECLEAAAWCALYAADAEQAIVDVVNLAGESSTLGAVTGGVVGIFWGTDALPPRWLEKLHQRRRIERLARRLAELRRA